jgi:cytochrome c oxidase subunit II
VSPLCQSARAVPLAGALMLAGCGGRQSAIARDGKAASEILDLFWTFLAVCTIVWILVVLAMAIGAWRRRSLEDATRDPLAPHRRDTMAARVVAAAVGATAVILVALTVLSYFTSRSIATLAEHPAVEIRVTGHQWWWEVTYDDPKPDRQVTTANEIHVPVGERVKIELEAGDVIHSLWIPNLAGKKDLIPGRQNDLDLLVERPGVYRGQCAEFCGLQHAQMALTVIAEPRPAYEAWQTAQIAGAARPSSEEARAGADVFAKKGCVMCHAVRGTRAGGHLAPDLTHVASRRSLAADTLPMNRGALAAWIADPQAVKPGAKMPRIPMTADELQSVVSYVEGLK